VILGPVNVGKERGVQTFYRGEVLQPVMQPG
jgi:hypothetical protein